MNDRVTVFIDRLQSVRAPEHVLKLRVEHDRDTSIIRVNLKDGLGGINVFHLVIDQSVRFAIVTERWKSPM